MIDFLLSNLEFLYLVIVAPIIYLIKWFFAVNADRKELKRQISQLESINKEMAADFKVVNTLINDLSKDFNSRITELLQSFYQRERND